MEENTSPLDSGKFSQKIIAVAAGEAHTLALTGDGSVYSWGRGTFGRLGNGSESDNLYPIRVNFSKSSSNGGASDDKEIKMVEIAAGAYHSLALADDGSVWAWGYNCYGQIGSEGDHSLLPCLVEGFLESDTLNSDVDGQLSKTKKACKVSSVKAGGMFSVAIDVYGSLWMWGNYPHGNIGEFGPTRCSVPLPTWTFFGRTVVKVACGNEHVVVVVRPDETFKGYHVSVYSWGSNSHGQLGLGDKDNRSSPEVIQSFESESIHDIACGAYHTAILTNKKDGNNTFGSDCWTFGLGENGQLGHGTTRDSVSPEPVKGLPENVVLKSVDCGLFHTSVVSTSGYIWSWGMEKGLGLCPGASFEVNYAGDALYPLLITCTDVHHEFPEPVQIACGAAHTVIIVDKGYKLWSWGRGQFGVLGNGSTVDHFTPVTVTWPPNPKENAENRENNGKNPFSTAMDEVLQLQTKLSTMEKYASMLHGSIFGKPFEVKDIPVSIQNSGTTFDMSREWEKMLDTLDEKKLLQLEMFYNNMLTGVKDKKMNKKIQRLMREGLNAREDVTPRTLNPGISVKIEEDVHRQM